MEENENGLKSFQERVMNLYVEHPEVVRIWKRLDRNRWLMRMGADSDDSPIHLFIEGKPGAGKTQLIKKYLRRNPIIIKIDEEGTEIDTRPVLYMTLPVPFTYKGFYNNILKSMVVVQSSNS
ncbi:putative GTPase [Paenibacillus sp. V4I9]|uniref:TniB family NTP-binding protein n=1 Tax=Paenibacillus sp. V4I9 TaxID=3042308 RepID=UPI002788C56B|nr:TniB family NTP-binding protein [Paenibacillus sp. V4I9]MDQ0890267.1 putative GTPase [Paenibacillus sp. V4I9]